MLASSTQHQNRSFYVVEGTRTVLNYTKKKNVSAKLLIFIVKYAMQTFDFLFAVVVVLVT